MKSYVGLIIEGIKINSLSAFQTQRESFNGNGIHSAEIATALSVYVSVDHQIPNDELTSGLHVDQKINVFSNRPCKRPDNNTLSY